MPNGTAQTVITNHAGEVLLRKVSDGRVWRDYTRYDDFGRVFWEAAPSAVASHSESPGAPTAFGGDLTSGLRADAGLITVYSYSPAGGTGPQGYLWKVAQAKGRNGAAAGGILQQQLGYQARTHDGRTIQLLSSSTAHADEDGSKPLTTTLGYTTWTQFQPTKISTSLGGVTASQEYDAYGRPTVFIDGDSYAHLTEYDPATGAVLRTTVDYGGEHLTTDYGEFDHLARPRRITSPRGSITRVTYNEQLLKTDVETWIDWTGQSGSAPPRQVVTVDRAAGKTWRYANAGSTLAALVLESTDLAGRLETSDRYFNLSGINPLGGTGSEGTNYYRTRNRYNSAGIVDQVTNAVGTITQTVLDGLSRPTMLKVGTSPANLAPVKSIEYDNGAEGGDSNVTKITLHPSGSTSPTGSQPLNCVTEMFYDWRNRLVATRSGSGETGTTPVLEYLVLDNVGRTRERVIYGDAGIGSTVNGVPQPPAPTDSTDPGPMRAKTTHDYDARGRVNKTAAFSVTPIYDSAGQITAGDLDPATKLETTYVYNDRDLLTETHAPGGLVRKSEYDGAGRLMVSTAGSASTNLEETHRDLDDDGNEILTTIKKRQPDGQMRVSYWAHWYDAADRLTDSVDVGTNGGTAYSRPATPPAASSDTLLLTHLGYDSAGHVLDVIDPRGNKAHTLHDALGRVYQKVEAYDPNVNGGQASFHNNRITNYEYTALDQIKKVTTYNARPGQVNAEEQITQHDYGVDPTKVFQTGGPGSLITSNDLVWRIHYPNEGGDPASGSEFFRYNALGETVGKKDRNQVTHDYHIDTLGRVRMDQASFAAATPSSIDQRVKKLEWDYDALGRLWQATSKGDVSGSWGVINQVRRSYDGLGQLKYEWQAHDGEVNAASTPVISYGYAYSQPSNYSRLASVSFPSGYTLSYEYGGDAINNAISRVHEIRQGSESLEKYEYLGLGSVVGVTREASGQADMTMALDHFGRPQNVEWKEGSTAVASMGYTYDRGGNMLSRGDRSFTYDALGSMISTTQTGVTNSWDVDTQGNRYGGDHYQSASYNYNRLVSENATGAGFAQQTVVEPSHSNSLQFDAWGRLVRNQQGTMLKIYEYDALGRRAQHTDATLTPKVTDSYYDGGQVGEEYNGGTLATSFAFAPDGRIIFQKQHVAVPHTWDVGRLWAHTDAEHSTITVTHDNGQVYRSYRYDQDGRAMASSGDGTQITGQWIGFEHLYQGGRFEFQQSQIGNPVVIYGLYDTGNGRWYNPNSGRPLQPDPIAEAQGRNQYFAEHYDAKNEASTGEKVWQWTATIALTAMTGGLYAGLSGALMAVSGLLAGAVGGAALGAAITGTWEGVEAGADWGSLVGGAAFAKAGVAGAKAASGIGTWMIQHPGATLGIAGVGLFLTAPDAEGSTLSVASRFLSKAKLASVSWKSLEWLARADSASRKMRTFSTQIMRGAAPTGFEFGAFTGRGKLAQLFVPEVNDVTGVVREASLTAFGLGRSGVRTLERNLGDLERAIMRLTVDKATKQTLLLQAQTGKYRVLLFGSKEKGTTYLLSSRARLRRVTRSPGTEVRLL